MKLSKVGGVPNIHNVNMRHMSVNEIISGECRAVYCCDLFKIVQVGDILNIQDSDKQSVVRVVCHIQEVENGHSILSIRKLSEREQEGYNE